ncbi:MAG: hypothetical protein M3O46_04335 [Myxococcota bacterium]|nr:hypothetical protein [Myxococcota bacterium]
MRAGVGGGSLLWRGVGHCVRFGVHHGRLLLALRKPCVCDKRERDGDE